MPRFARVLPGYRQPLRTTEVFVNDVAAHAVGRADIVLRRKVGEGSPEILKEPLVPHGDLDPGRAPLPDAHEPDGVKAMGGDGIPLLLRNRGEVHGPLVFPAQFTQPDPGVDLINDRMLGPRFHLFCPPAPRLPCTNAGLLARLQDPLGIQEAVELDESWPRARSSRSDGWRPARRRCRRGSIRRRGCGRASGDRSGTSPCRRRRAAGRARRAGRSG